MNKQWEDFKESLKSINEERPKGGYAIYTPLNRVLEDSKK